MKILLLQLSDLHISDNSLTTNNTISCIVNSLRELPEFDEVTIILSGDLAYSGKKHEYEHVGHFIGKLITSIRKEFWDGEYKKIEVVTVPGNHDVSFESNQRNRNEVKKLSKDCENTITEELKLQTNFFEFANRNNCFLSNKLVDIKTVCYGSYEIQFNLINTAPFSTLNDENGDNDKDLHCIPEEYLQLLKRTTTSSISCTVMHHNTDWFNWESKKSLEATINKDSSILFVGHDHLPQISFSTINGELDCIIAKGGTFNDPAISNNFVAITFDTDKQEFTTYSMVFGDKVFNVTKRDSKIIDIPFRYKDFILSKSFLLKLNEISWDGINPNTIFEFPTLKKSQTDEFKENKQIGNYEDFIQNIKDKDFCLLEGNELSGKSFLLKFLYKKSFVNGVPIFINANDIYKGDNIEKLIKRNFEEQYGEDKDLYSKYNQLDKQEKIVFIDNIDKVKDQQEFIIKLKKFYGIIFATSKPIQYDIRELILDRTKEETNVIKYTIEPFYYEKRIKLIKKICTSLYGEENISLIEKKAKDINNFICENLKLFNISPYFILAFSTNYIKRPSGSDNKLNVFGEVFRSNIIQNFNKASEIKVETAFFILEEVALKIFKDRTYPLSISAFIEVIDKYNKDYDQKINALNFIKDLEDCKILKSSIEKAQSYKFDNDNILAFFIAKKIIDLKEHPDVKQFLHHLITFISFGINSEILMFVIALRNDWDLLNLILAEVESQTKDWQEFSFQQNNLSFLNNNIKTTVINAPTPRNKQIVIDDREKHERNVKNSQLKTIDIFDYTEKDLERFINLQTRAIKELTLISTLYSNFYYMIPAHSKNDFMDYIYKQPNKIIYYMLSPFDENFNEFIDGLYNELSEENKNLQKNDLIDIFIKISELVILNVYWSSSQHVGSDETIDSLIKYVDKSQSTNNEIQLILTLDSMERLNQFGKRVESLDRQTSLSIIKDMVKNMVYHYFLTHDVPLKDYGQHLAATYFKNNKKLLKQVQNRSLRKNR